MQSWLDSPERQKLLEEAGAFTEEYHARIARTGFDQWFPVDGGGTSPPAAWKQNMIVLLLLYPVVFLFGAWVQTPWLMQPGQAAVLPLPVHRQHRQHRPAQLAGPVGQQPLRVVVAARRRPPTTKTNLAGAAVLAGLYALTLLVFWRLF